MNYDIFISYRTESALDTAANLAHVLRETWKYQVFFDKKSLRGGTLWSDEINVALESTRCFVILLSAGCLQRTSEKDDVFCREIERALARSSNDPEVKIMPFRLRGFDPSHFSIMPEKMQKLAEIQVFDAQNQIAPSMAKDIAKCVGIKDSYVDYQLSILRGSIQSFLSNNDQKGLYREMFKFEQEYLLPDARIEAVREEESKKLGCVPEPRIQLRSAAISTVAPSRLLVALEIADQLTQQFGAETCNQIRAAMGLSADKAKFSVPMVMDFLVEIGFITPKSSPNVNHQLTEAGRRFGSEDGLILRWKNEVVALLSQKAKEKIVTLKEEVKQVPVPIVEEKPVVQQPLKPVVPPREEIQQQAPASVVEEKPVVQQSKPVFPIKLPVETLTYDQLVKLVISALGKEKCEEVRAAMGLEVSSTSFMVIHVLKEIGIFSFLEEDNAVKISDYGMNFCIEKITDDFANQTQRVEIQWKSEVFSFLIKKMSEFSSIDWISKIEISSIQSGQLLDAEDVQRLVVKEIGNDNIKKICLLLGWNTDEYGINFMISDIIDHRIGMQVNSDGFDYPFFTGIFSLTTDEGHQHGFEMMELKINICAKWDKKIMPLILKIIEKKINCKVYVSDNFSDNEDLIFSSDIADFIYKNLDVKQRKTLTMSVTGKEDYKPNRKLVSKLIAELGFIKESGYDDPEYNVRCLTEQGKSFGTTSEYIGIDLLGWKPTIIPIVCSYLKRKLNDYDGTKEGDFISQDELISAITNPIKEKTYGICNYVSQSQIAALENSDIFRQFYFKKPGHNRWKPEVIPHIIGYIVNNSILDFKKHSLFRTTEQATASKDEKYDKYYIVGHTTLRNVKKQNLSAYIAKVTGKSGSEVSKVIESTHGGTLVKNAFLDYYTPKTVGNMSKNTALEYGVVATIAYKLDLEIDQVLSRLNSAGYNEKVSQLFAAEWAI